VIEPDHGIILDPACGSGGMFVQSSHFIEDAGQDTMKRVTFYGHEKNETTARLAQINLAVHGLQGTIRAGNEAITYYKDPHELIAKCDFVMANPPFNVDEVDADKIKGDKRLPFGLPGVNKAKKVSNANYLWLSYFYSYLNETGRAGVVMSSQASSAGRDEATVRQKLIETGAVDVMIDIRGNFFYTRTVPCPLWFFDRAKEKDEARRTQVLMLDARNIFRKVSRSVCDFSPEQQKNIAAVVWLYRGQSERFLKLVESYLQQAIEEGEAANAPLRASRKPWTSLLGSSSRSRSSNARMTRWLTHGPNWPARGRP
jgi:type I restriction enzyme M protein